MSEGVFSILVAVSIFLPSCSECASYSVLLLLTLCLSFVLVETWV